jgi:stearoyl-CoA desaturase (delta-9 desaturase)
LEIAMSLLWMILITVGILQMSVFFTTIYLHRCLTHRGLDLHPALALFMHVELVFFPCILPRESVAVHRKHHHFSDQDGNPHSPYLLGMWTVLFSNFWLYKKEKDNLATIAKYTPDYKPDLIDRKVPFQHFMSLGGMAIFMLMFGWVWGFAAWAFHGVVYILLNSMINSLCHMIGYRNYDNLATNLQWVAILTGGEGLHNNHHEYPSSARFAQKRREIDPAWLLIKLLRAMGLATIKPEPIAKAA